MSIQFNYFASGPDHEVVASTILDVFGPLYAFPDRSHRDDMVKRIVNHPDQLIRFGRDSELMLTDRPERVVLRGDDDTVVMVDFRESPVLEYCQPQEIDKRDIKIGRTAAFSHDPELRKLTNRLHRRLKRRATRLEGAPGFWIFPHARDAPRRLLDWINIDLARPQSNNGDGGSGVE